MNSWDDVGCCPIRQGDIRRDVSMQCALEGLTIAKFDGDDGNGRDTDPGGLEVLIDERSQSCMREQHGSRETSIGSAQLFIQSAQ